MDILGGHHPHLAHRCDAESTLSGAYACSPPAVRHAVTPSRFESPASLSPMISKLALGCIMGAVMLALAFGSTIATGGCQACDSGVCNSRLGISVEEPGGVALAPGMWTFELVVDGQETLVATCEIGESSRSASCSQGPLSVSPIIRDDPRNPCTLFLISIEGGDGLEGLPRVLDMAIEHDGIIVYDTTYDIDYERSEPEHCDPDCFSAYLDIVVAR